MKLIKDITTLCISKLDDIEEFRAFTQMAYNISVRNIDQGLKLKLYLATLGKKVNQQHLKDRLISYENDYLPQLSFLHMVAIFELWFFDTLRSLLNNPLRLNKKRKIEVSDIIGCTNIAELLNKIVELELNEVRYKKVENWFQYLGNFVNISVPSQEDIGLIAEIKASRDIIVHNDGMANSIYLIKSGNKARCKEGEKLEFDHDYVFFAWKVLRAVIISTGDAISKKEKT